VSAPPVCRLVQDFGRVAFDSCAPLLKKMMHSQDFVVKLTWLVKSRRWSTSAARLGHSALVRSCCHVVISG
jgi:hypothetical protein